MLMTIICLSLLVFSAWYVPYRLGRLWGFKRAWPLSAAVFLLLAGFYGVLATGAYTSASPAAALAYNALGLFFVFHIYLFMFLLAAHLLAPLLKTVPARQSPRRAFLSAWDWWDSVFIRPGRSLSPNTRYR